MAQNEWFSNAVYRLLFGILGLIYVVGLFVPLMDTDAAHHANIGLHMYLTGDYVDLIDNGKNYLDKPHFLFWLSALGYHLFGINSFAYKFFPFLFTIGSVYSTYRLGGLLYNKQTGKLAALVCATAFAFILQNNDVRMDAVLTSGVVFSLWQGVAFQQTKKVSHAILLSLGLVIGFSTKGMIGVAAPCVGIFFYILYKKDYRVFLNAKWLLVLLCFALLISPVVYCYYLQFDKHPDIVVRGKDHISGVRFILWKQNTERYAGEDFSSGSINKDPFFFLHNFLWAFAPWSLLVYIALAGRIRHFFSYREEWLSTGFFVVLMIMFSFSGYKLPHYLNILFPVCGIMVAHYVVQVQKTGKAIKAIFILQLIISILLVLGAFIINVIFFPVNNLLIGSTAVLLFGFLLWTYRSRQYVAMPKMVLIGSVTMAFCFFLLNANFFPKLLTYQSGNNLAALIKGKIPPEDVYFYKETQSNSFVFYSKSLYKQFNDSVLINKPSVWLLSDSSGLVDMQRQHYKTGKQFYANDYHVSKLKLSFLNPATRKNVSSKKMYLTEVFKN